MFRELMTPITGQDDLYERDYQNFSPQSIRVLPWTRINNTMYSTRDFSMKFVGCVYVADIKELHLTNAVVTIKKFKDRTSSNGDFLYYRGYYKTKRTIQHVDFIYDELQENTEFIEYLLGNQSVVDLTHRYINWYSCFIHEDKRLITNCCLYLTNVIFHQYKAGLSFAAEYSIQSPFHEHNESMIYRSTNEAPFDLGSKYTPPVITQIGSNAPKYSMRQPRYMVGIAAIPTQSPIPDPIFMNLILLMNRRNYELDFNRALHKLFNLKAISIAMSPRLALVPSTDYNQIMILYNQRTVGGIQPGKNKLTLFPNISRYIIKEINQRILSA